MAEQRITCPQCGAAIELTEVITRQLESTIRAEYQAKAERSQQDLQKKVQALDEQQKLVAAREQAIDAEVTEKLKSEKAKLIQEAEAKATRQLSEKNRVLQDELKDKTTKLTEANQRERELRKAQTELEEKQKNLDLEVQRLLDAEKKKVADVAKAQAQGEFASIQKGLEAQLREKTAKLEEANKTELKLRQDKQRLEEREKALDLEVQRKLDLERKKVSDEATARVADEYRLKIRQKDDLAKALERKLGELQKRIETGSQEAQGEALEHDLKDTLAQAFPFDVLVEIKKGARGADILHRVRNQAGKECGTILWESKNAQGFEKKWVAKLKTDQREASADVAVLMSMAIPKDMGCFGQYDGVWITDYRSTIGLAAALRQGLMDVARQKIVTTSQDTVKDILYRYVTGQEFALQVKGVVDAFNRMQQDLHGEKVAMTRIWKSREAQIQAVIQNVVSIRGSIEGYVGGRSVLPPIDALALEAVADDGHPQ
jgi:hypothetical protein